jgi:hypothetical protein
MSFYTEDHLIVQPAIQLMQHKLGWDVVSCYDEWTLLRQGFEGQGGGLSALGRDGKREVVLVSRLRPALQRLNLDLPVDHSSPTILCQRYERQGLRMAWAIEGAVGEVGILNVGSVVAFGLAGTSFWILNGRGRRQAVLRLDPALSLAEGLICPPAKFWDHLREPAP